MQEVDFQIVLTQTYIATIIVSILPLDSQVFMTYMVGLTLDFFLNYGMIAQQLCQQPLHN